MTGLYFANVRRFRKSRQKGVVLLIALVVLIAMTLAGIALVRSVETGNMVAGNLAFKQSLAYVGDAGNEDAIAWLTNQQATALVNNDQEVSGYYATEQGGLDVTNSQNNADMAAVDWDDNGCSGLTYSVCVKPSTAVMKGDNKVSYIINRLCQFSGSYNDPSNSCATYSGAGTQSSNKQALDWGGMNFEGDPVPYYRVVSRVLGPRNTTAFVQTVIHF